MIAATYYVSWNSDVVRTWLYARLTVAAVGVMAIMPSVVGCCAMAAPVVGQLLVGAVIIAAFAYVTKPRAK